MRFEQGPLDSARFERAGEYDKFSARCSFIDKETKEEVQTPNIWYNQPISARVEAMEFYAIRAEECAKEQQRLGYKSRCIELQEDATRIRKLIQKMIVTGEVLA